MISLPIVLTYKDISVFPDHEDCNMYYCLRSTPQVRINDAGEPVFRSIFWSSDKADDDKTFSGVRGGRMTFDVNLRVSDDEYEEIRKKLSVSGIQSKRYNEIIAREKKRENLISAVSSSSIQNKNDDKDEDEKLKNSMTNFLNGESEAARLRIPQVGNITFGAVNYSSGSFELNEENGGSLIEWHNGTRKPSMFGDNNSAIAVQFTPEGAAVAYRAIQQKAQSVSVYFDMKIRMCMPALNVRIYAGSVQTASIARHLVKGSCDKIKAREITQILTDMGFINIEVTNLSTDLDDKTVNDIVDSMKGILEKKVEEIITTKIAPMSPEEREKNVEMTIEQEFKSFTELNYSQNSVFEFNFAPQATISEFFKNVNEEQLKKMVTLIDMSEEVFSWKRNMLCACAPWEEKPFVNMIRIECEYPSLPEGHKDRIRSFKFDKDNQTAEWDFMKPKNDDSTILYTPYVYLKGHSDFIQMPTQKANGEYVMVNVGKIGLIDVSFRAHPNVTSLPGDLKVSGMQVDLWYNDANGNIIMGPEQIVLNELDKEVKFERNLGIVLDQPLHYKVTYLFKQIDPIPLPEKTFYMGDDGETTIYADFPFKNRKSIQVLLPFEPDNSIKEIYGDIHYGQYAFPVKLSKEDEWESPKINLCSRDENNKDFTYQFSLKYENGDYPMLKSGLMKGSIESSSLVVPIRVIEVAGIDLLDLGTKYYQAIVEIHFPEGFGSPIEFRLSKKDNELESKKFYCFCPEDKKLELNWTMTLTDMEGKGLPSVKGKTENLFIILTPPKTNK